eukprot:m.273955 g.273955  ORF g.273955 m.273955 type:complete len:157 (+) comp16128_c0_seq4:3313-3783(+)
MAGLGFEERAGGLKNLTARLIGDNERAVGTCRKCGFAGHLAFQCRNTITAQSALAEVKSGAAAAATVVDVSSTSSEESDDSILGLDTPSEDDESQDGTVRIQPLPLESRSRFVRSNAAARPVFGALFLSFVDSARIASNFATIKMTRGCGFRPCCD